METKEITKELLRLAEEKAAKKDRERPEIKWLKKEFQEYMRREGLQKKDEADGRLYRAMYGRAPAGRAELLKLRYWRTGQHYPVTPGLCLLYGRALGLTEEKLLFLIRGYYDSCDRYYEWEETEDPAYRERRLRMDALVRDYVAGIPAWRLEEEKIPPRDASHYIRHLYFTDALRCVSACGRLENSCEIRHLSSVNYDSELKRSLRLIGTVPRKTMIRHLILLGRNRLSLPWLNEQLQAFGYLPLQEGHTLRTGENIDCLLLRLLEWYDSLGDNTELQDKEAGLHRVLRALDTYLEASGQERLRFMYFKALRG